MPTTEGYNGAYTGQQIDEAIGKAQQIDEKISSHNESVDAHSEKFDEYLPLTGGIVTALQLGAVSPTSSSGNGELDFRAYDQRTFPDHIKLESIKISAAFTPYDPDQSFVTFGGTSFSVSTAINITGHNDGYALRLNGNKITYLGDPQYLYDAANKKYVDSKIPKSIPVTLSASSWSSNTQTVTVDGILADEASQLIQPIPSMASQSLYIDSGILCTLQAENSLTFTCDTVPSSDIDLYIAIQEVSAL